MSTRSQLYVKGSDVVLYRHSDGYPEGKGGVLACILPFLAEFSKHRNDPFYCSAQLLGYLIKATDKVHNHLARWRKKHRADTNEEDYRGNYFLGTGVESFKPEKTELHGDIEYFYVIDEEKRVVEVRIPFEEREIWGINATGDMYCDCVLIATFAFDAKPPHGKTQANSLRKKFLEDYAKSKGKKTPAVTT